MTEDDPKPVPTPREDLITRFAFSAADLKDKRVKRWLLFKLELDREIRKLHKSHDVRGNVDDKLSAYFGFTKADLAQPNIAQAMRAISASVSYLAKLRLVNPKPAVPAAKPLTPAYPPTQEKR
jgi:hypothetical protein